MPPKPPSTASPNTRGPSPGSSRPSQTRKRTRNPKPKSSAKPKQSRSQPPTNAPKPPEHALLEVFKQLKQLRLDALIADTEGKAKEFNQGLQPTLEPLRHTTHSRILQEANSIQFGAQQYLRNAIDAITLGIYLDLESEMESLNDKYPHQHQPHPEWLRESWSLLERLYRYLDYFQSPWQALGLLKRFFPQEDVLEATYENRLTPLRDAVGLLIKQHRRDESTGALVRGIIVALLDLLPDWFGGDGHTALTLKHQALANVAYFTPPPSPKSATTTKSTQNTTIAQEWEYYRNLTSKAATGNNAKQATPPVTAVETTHSLEDDASSDEASDDETTSLEDHIVSPSDYESRLNNIVDHFYVIAVDTIEFLDDCYTIPPEESFKDALTRIFGKVYQAQFTSISEARKHQTATTKEVLHKVDQIVGSMAVKPNEVVEFVGDLNDFIDKVYTDAIMFAIESQVPMAYFDDGTHAYSSKESMLSDFQKVKPHMIKVPWGNVSTNGSGFLTIYDDQNRGLKMQAECILTDVKSIDSFKLSDRHPAWIPKRYLIKSGYDFVDLGKEGSKSVLTYNHQTYRNKAGGIIWVLNNDEGNACLPMKYTPKLKKMIRVFSRLQNISYENFCERGGLSDDDFSDDEDASDDEDTSDDEDASDSD
ncbi:hypothetical protein DIURU_002748 [Diutina rugosa]|uniref:Uncharacterized protein n=1 Tax=Diutina rugosa TaxID=5481 RepID=A0A642UNT0_DIURU|nr:uncharacterized protein DIURU_002748 [Diutina rugosa]KAA8902639.1 hypothetical protein DIURU_002748 [Diutina rugosa]